MSVRILTIKYQTVRGIYISKTGQYLNMWVSPERWNVVNTNAKVFVDNEWQRAIEIRRVKPLHVEPISLYIHPNNLS